MAAICISAGISLAEGPLIPMTAITGNPQRPQIVDMLSTYKSVGIDRFLIYPRSGLEIEYMSDEWFRFCRDCIEVADSLGMKIWLYDEYNWPSGNCRGAVTADGHEDCYPKVLIFDNDGRGRYSTRVATNAIGADILNPEAASRFVSLTHERYYEAFKPYFGNVIQAIFTDEPSFSYSMTSAAGMMEANFTKFDHDHFAITWYPELEEEYAAACGRDLQEDVKAYLAGAPSAELWQNYYTLVGDRMRTNYIQRLASWCDDHGIELTGHLMYEKLYKSVRCNGNALKMLSCFGIPGFDEANSDIDLGAREMEISGLSLAQYAGRGKSGEMCELYSVGPADNPMSLMRQLMWLCAAYGIDNYVVAVAATDARGNVEKGDWYFPSGPTQPWFDYYREFGEDARKAADFARKEYEPEVLVRVPSTYFMGLDKTPAFEREGVRYLRFLEHLVSWQLQYMLLDEGEDPDGLPVLGFGQEGFYIEGEDRRFEDLEEYFNHITEVIDRAIVVTDCGGSEVRDVLARRWADGSITLVDVTDNDTADRLLNVRTKSGEGTVRLQGHGAYAGPVKVHQKIRRSHALELADVELKRDSTNLVRCIYLQGKPEFNFIADADINDVRILIRSDVKPVMVELDGRPIEAESAATRLPQGFRELYSASKPFCISASAHTIRILGGEADYRYLPGVLMEGDFNWSRTEQRLSPADGKGELTSAGTIPEYVGSYSITGKCKLHKRIKLDTHLACTELIVDGKSLGRKAWGPYEWRIPLRYRIGTHEVAVRISTSIMPMFGEISRLEEEQPYVSWLRIKPGMHGDKTTSGLFQ